MKLEKTARKFVRSLSLGLCSVTTWDANSRGKTEFKKHLKATLSEVPHEPLRKYLLGKDVFAHVAESIWGDYVRSAKEAKENHKVMQKRKVGML